MIGFDDITACLVTRGNVPMEPILEALPYGEVIVWDNSKRADLKTYGRYQAALYGAKNTFVYFQDDDVIFREHDALLAEFNATSDVLVANDGHGGNYAGYEDLAWCGCGAIVHASIIQSVFHRWFARWPSQTEEFLYEADAVFGILAPFRHVELPWQRLYDDDDTRLCRQPWQEGLKLKYANMAREIRDAS